MNNHWLPPFVIEQIDKYRKHCV
jgi:hypothetical protein